MHTKEYDKGYIAGEANQPSASNPFQHDTTDYYEWSAGWSAAREDWNFVSCDGEDNDKLVLIVLAIILIGTSVVAAKVIGWL